MSRADVKSPNCGEGAFGGNPCLAPPPRAWGRQTFTMNFGSGTGNTPTCVGKTAGCVCAECVLEKHLHVRGEDNGCLSNATLWRETPPRAWGRQVGAAFKDTSLRNTPTCVGKTCADSASPPNAKKHPHVRGEDYISFGYGSSDSRNTPTCVGKTMRVAYMQRFV